MSALVEALGLLFSSSSAITPTQLLIPHRNVWAATRALRYRRRPAQRAASMRRARKLKYRWYR
ncbi:hypothetical protein [Burkholderia cenocepacia]|uniref:hypothetical protein n=1 Tax=Burkholderia cenocepacia TaxID=95486 RepID=UPI00158ECB2C|nr:hypothetical protein [Burkholderia cenocepacia]